jgi:hypothetical protein
MTGVIRDVLVVGYEPLIDVVVLPDPDDRHVVAAAIRARTQVIVTANIRDFPAASLAAGDVEAACAGCRSTCREHPSQPGHRHKRDPDPVRGFPRHPALRGTRAARRASAREQPPRLPPSPPRVHGTRVGAASVGDQRPSGTAGV